MRDYSGDVPGASVLVVHNGKITFRKSYGMANLEHSVPVTPETKKLPGVMLAGSIAWLNCTKMVRLVPTKLFCVVAITMGVLLFMIGAIGL